MQGPRAIYGKESKAEQTNKQTNKQKKKVSRWCSGHKSYCSRLYEQEPQHGSKGQEQGPLRNHKDMGQCSETADIIQQSSRAELGWAVRMQKKKKKKSSVYMQNG